MLQQGYEFFLGLEVRMDRKDFLEFRGRRWRRGQRIGRDEIGKGYDVLLEFGVWEDIT